MKVDKHMKATTVYTVLRDLCQDIGWQPKFTESEFSYAVLGELRLELLRLSRSEGRDGFCPVRLSNLWSKLTRYFHVPFGRDELIQPVCFGECYQVLSYVLKVQINHTYDHEQEYIRKLKELLASNSAYTFDRSNPINRLARFAFRMATKDCDLRGFRGGRHGPGAVYDREVGDDKNVFNPPSDQVLARYNEDAFFANSEYQCELTGTSIRWREQDRDRFNLSRLALVPKDYKGPRGVYISHKETVFLQLLQGDALQRNVQKSWLRNCYDPCDQAPSKEVAYMGSYNGGWSTLDLKDASDRITLSLVNGLAYRSDYLDLCATRPTFLELPNGEIIKSRMFSPMGDGKTFPVLSYICACLAVAAILDQDGIVPSRVCYDDLIDASKKCRVFGDDVAVHDKYFTAVCDAFSLNNLKVNLDKSFPFGSFREACGMDAFKGVDITPIRLRVDPTEITSLDSLKGLIDMHNRIACLRPTWLRTLNTLERLVQAHTDNTVAFTLDPVRNPEMLYDRHAMQRNLSSGRFIRVSSLHRLEVRTMALRGIRKYPSSLDPRWDLNYWLLSKGSSDHAPDPFTVRCVSSVGSPWAREYLNKELSKLNPDWAIPKPSIGLSTRYGTIFP